MCGGEFLAENIYLLSVGGPSSQPFPGVFDQQPEDKVFDLAPEEVRHEGLPVEDSVRNVLLSIAVSFHSERRGT